MFIPYLGKYRLINLDTKTIQTELVNRMTNEPNAKTGKPNSFSTIKKPYDIVNACLKYAVKVGDITSNPCENVVLPKERKTDAKQIRPLTTMKQSVSCRLVKSVCHNTNGYTAHSLYGAAYG